MPMELIMPKARQVKVSAVVVKDICSIQDLLVVLEEDNNGYGGSIWYRGQADLTWGLVPGYLRFSNAPSESTLLKRFKQSAALLVGTTPGKSFDWLFWMQHYGVPTRLLDWSESPLVALYFAVEGWRAHPDKDAALWSLRPSELNKKANINNVNEEFFIPSFDDEELENYTVESLGSRTRTTLMPVATIATRNNSRIQAQHGVFTIHHNDPIGIEGVGDSSHVIKYKIPADRREFICKQLTLLGITKFQMFPELASIGDIIKESLS